MGLLFQNVRGERKYRKSEKAGAPKRTMILTLQEELHILPCFSARVSIHTSGAEYPYLTYSLHCTFRLLSCLSEAHALSTSYSLVFKRSVPLSFAIAMESDSHYHISPIA